MTSTTTLKPTETTDTRERREFGSLRLRGSIWWLRYRVNGQEHWESSRSTSQRKAQKILDRRQAELAIGQLTVPDAKRVTFADLAQLLRDDYRVRGRRTLTVKIVGGQEQFGGALEDSLKRLTAFFGACRALAITSDRVTAYERAMLADGYARATVNKDLAALRRAFNLAVRARRLPLSAKPAITTPDPHNARQGFFGLDDFHVVLAELPEPLRPALQFAYWTGWRVQDEVLVLTWAQVDFTAGIVRLEPNTTKTDEGRVFPFDVLPELRDLLKRQRDLTTRLERATGQIIPHVFHRAGRPIKSYHNAWRAACERAAVLRGPDGKPIARDGKTVIVRPQLVGRVPHDFRRTAARNLIRAGVPQHVVMRLCGWKTDAMFRRYAIVDERDLRDAVALLARGTIGDSRPSEASDATC